LDLPVAIFNSHTNYWRKGKLESAQGSFVLACLNSDRYFARTLHCSGFHVIRDPRDIVVSGYFSHRSSHPVGPWHRLAYYREHLQSVDMTQGLLAEISFSANFLHEMFSWDYTDPRILELRFEDLVTDPEAHFLRVFAHVGAIPPLDPSDLSRIIRKRRFEKLSGGRRPGEENTDHHYRSGKAGDWRSHFEPVHVDLFRKLYNPLLLKLGYETREDWS
jgi:hypothetical protein